MEEEIKGLDEAADKYLDTQDVAEMFCGDYEGWQIIDAFKAGAEWMASKLVPNKGYREITGVRTSAITTTIINKTAVCVTDGKPHNPSFIE